VRPSVVVRLELASSERPPRISVREDSEGAVAYVNLAFPEGQVSLCIRHPRQASQLQEALSRAIVELQEVASFTT
jgi:hypothetical protein